MSDFSGQETPRAPTVLCFGEVLWDCLPRGLFAGGAPINVAYHLQRLGLQPIPVTAVGQDFLGRELLRRFDRWRLTRDAVTIVPDKETGAVLVQLDAQGVASYEIVEDVAWDWIQLDDTCRSSAARAAAIVYGSLAQRAENNRRELKRLKEWAPQARRIYDINLRAPFDTGPFVRQLCEDADLIKLNHEELGRMLSQPHTMRSLERDAREFGRTVGCDKICVTAGSDGAGLLWDGTWIWEPAQPVDVKDTIGAGDSFLAGLLRGWLLDNLHPTEILASACRLSEFVAGSDGAMPSYHRAPNGSIHAD